MGFSCVCWPPARPCGSGVGVLQGVGSSPCSLQRPRQHDPRCTITFPRRRTKRSTKWFHQPRPLSIVTRCSFLFSHLARLHTSMMYMTFSEWLARRTEGLLLPDRPPLKGMPKTNTTLGTDAQRRRRSSPARRCEATTASLQGRRRDQRPSTKRCRPSPPCCCRGRSRRGC